MTYDKNLRTEYTVLHAPGWPGGHLAAAHRVGLRYPAWYVGPPERPTRQGESLDEIVARVRAKSESESP